MTAFSPEVTTKNNSDYTNDNLVEACKSGAILRGKVIKSDDKLNLYVQLREDLVGIIPFSESAHTINGAAVKSIEIVSRVGKTIMFKVVQAEISAETGLFTVILSRKMAQEEYKEKYIDKLVVGQIIDAYVTRVERYGIFCDIGFGFVSLIPIGNFCISRVFNPIEAFKKCRLIKVAVMDINRADERVTLTHKELLGTWDEVIANFKEGDTVIGRVSTVEDYGVFIQLAPNLSGLAERTDGVSPGDKVIVNIKRIIPEKMKVKINIMTVEQWSTSDDISEYDYKIKDGILKEWVYSPECATRIIKTTFSN